MMNVKYQAPSDKNWWKNESYQDKSINILKEKFEKTCSNYLISILIIEWWNKNLSWESILLIV